MKKTLLYLLTAVLLVSFNSCDKDEDDKKPAFVGEWTISEEVNGTLMKDNLILTESTFESMLKLQVLPGIFVEYIGTKGTHTYTETTVTFTYTALGSADINWETGTAGTLEWHDAGTTEFNEMLSSMNVPVTLEAQWSVTGDKLNMKYDFNADGDNDDENEDKTYTRVK